MTHSSSRPCRFSKIIYFLLLSCGCCWRCTTTSRRWSSRQSYPFHILKLWMSSQNDVNCKIMMTFHGLWWWYHCKWLRNDKEFISSISPLKSCTIYELRSCVCVCAVDAIRTVGQTWGDTGKWNTKSLFKISYLQLLLWCVVSFDYRCKVGYDHTALPSPLWWNTLTSEYVCVCVRNCVFVSHSNRSQKVKEITDRPTHCSCCYLSCSSSTSLPPCCCPAFNVWLQIIKFTLL